MFVLFLMVSCDFDDLFHGFGGGVFDGGPSAAWDHLAFKDAANLPTIRQIVICGFLSVAVRVGVAVFCDF